MFVFMFVLCKQLSTYIINKMNIQFTKFRKTAFLGSIVLCLLSFFLIFTKGMNFGIDFTGGVVIEFRAETDVDTSKLRSNLADGEFGDFSIQNFGSAKDVLIRIEADESDKKAQTEAINKAKTIINSTLGGVDYRKVESVGTTIGNELKINAVLALLFAFIAIVIYITVRFEWQFGFGALIALIHDTILTLGFMSFMGIEFNVSSIAAILTIIGYSINDSVVIYDRIREFMRKYKKKEVKELIDISLNSTMRRTILTSTTTLASLVALVIFGGAVIKGFALTVLFGVIVGTYSSIFIAAPLLLSMNVVNMAEKERLREQREKEEMERFTS